ncbi:MAG: carbohydrate ABC transporter permease, partial [Pseudomonadota bacterium]|nr:carbohydrate ABC transporter permease [Pseudomonadota bacterium]
MSATEIRPTTAVLDRSAVTKPRNMGQILRWGLLFFGGILMVMPIAYMISTSLKWPHEVYNVNLVPEEPTIENYTYVLEDGRFY